MALDPSALPAAATEFLTERHIGTLVTLRADGSPHAVAVGFTWDASAQVARVITSGGNQKATNASRGGRAAVSQVDGARWITLEGTISVASDAPSVTDAEQRYAARYQPPRENPRRVVLVIRVDRVLGSSRLA